MYQIYNGKFARKILVINFFIIYRDMAARKSTVFWDDAIKF